MVLKLSVSCIFMLLKFLELRLECDDLLLEITQEIGFFLHLEFNKKIYWYIIRSIMKGT